MATRFLHAIAVLSALYEGTTSTRIAEIQGNAYQSPLVGQKVSGVTGLVTAKADSGFYLAGDPVDDLRVSTGLYVYTTSSDVLDSVTVGDSISLSGTVQEYRSSSKPDYLFLTELASPSDIESLSSNNTVTPVVLGYDRSPPTQKLSSLDVGDDGWLSVPNNQTRIEEINPTLVPSVYGLDFWESLEGQLVLIPSPTALNFENSYGEFWVYGNWTVTGKNGRGGLSLNFGSDGIPDANPETIQVGSPLDGTDNPKVAVGVTLSDIVGVVHYQFGYYQILPLTAPSVLTTPSQEAPPTSIVGDDDACSLFFGDYNVENMAPTSSHIPAVAEHIASYLLSPDILFVQEIQDNSGPTDDGTVSANVTLVTLANAIKNISGVVYDFVDIAPKDGEDGGQPGGNIRQAYLYRADKLQLVSGSPAGTALDAVEVQESSDGTPALNFNPGRIAPTNAAWDSSRKPLVAHWITPNGTSLFTINLHLTSKGGSSTTHANGRTPVNLGVEQRTSQVELVASFVGDILAVDPEANVIVAGDFNEYTQTRSVLQALEDIGSGGDDGLIEIDEAAGLAEVERYTYVYDQNTQQLDHAFVSGAIAGRGVEVEHVHVNNWVATYAERVSDHDPSVGKVWLC
ncbi:DNase I-like protein [Schizophyllum commune H4-8]|uniref:Endonuclease/exonuclease/phosphatase domain-containing protein n=1 Tax=Schizophyllum commune (strain H4-8 / FGSC 9210) TaxID=578458 RepID=D8Q028_SCHCM|nr:DNase I-like protein [Schizophyllum commune H4-8]KAI5896622.1 DNase I-like protein [Schizophyllum commune H4-8]